MNVNQCQLLAESRHSIDEIQCGRCIIFPNERQERRGNAMTLEQYAAIAEIIGVSLVIASLIYVAQQLRQNTEMMRAESRNQIVLGHQQELFTLVQNPDIWKGMSDEELDDESVRLNMWLTASLRARDHEWFQVRHGALDKAS